MDYRGQSSRLYRYTTKMDKITLTYIQSCEYLIYMFLILSLCTWNISLHHDSILIGMAIILIAENYIGQTYTLAAGIVFSFVVLPLEPISRTSITLLLINLIGFCCAAWIGFSIKKSENFSAYTDSYQIIPWTVFNDTRTSLAAMRYLLFSINQKQKITELERAYNELSRLEKMFKGIEENNS